MRTPTTRFTLADVDGTKPGVAMLISADLTTGEEATPMHATFMESADVPDPAAYARALWESIKVDRPNHTMTIIADPRALFLNHNTRVAALGMALDTPDEFLTELVKG